MMWVEEEEVEVAASFHNNWELAQLPCIFAWNFCHNNRWFWMMIRISTIWRLVFVAPKRNVPSSCNIIAFFWVPVPPLFVFISLKWPNISFFLKIKESGHLFSFSDYYISFHFYGPPFLLLLIEFFGSIFPSIFPIEKWCYCFCWAIVLACQQQQRRAYMSYTSMEFSLAVDIFRSSCIINTSKNGRSWTRERERDERLQVFECINEVVCGWLSSLSACLVICWRSIWVA